MKKYIITIAVLFIYVIGLAIAKRVFEIEIPGIAAYIPLIIVIVPLLFFKVKSE